MPSSTRATGVRLASDTGCQRYLTDEERAATADWIASVQRSDGEIPWFPGGKADPWDHIHAAMGLAAAGRIPEAKAAYRFLARTQYPDGGFAFERQNGRVVNSSRDSNHAAYLATGLWHLHTVAPSPEFLAEMWPAVERVVDFVVRLQEPSGAIWWAVDPEGRPWETPLLTGSSSVHGSLTCAIRIGARLGFDRPAWGAVRARLGRLLRERIEHFDHADLPEPIGRHSMDWYYPVLGGALRGAAARARLLDEDFARAFLHEGVGCRCVRERPWYTVAETCELAIAFDAAGMRARALEVLSWVASLRDDIGAYWTGVTHPEGELYPEGERTTWTAATVILADEVLAGDRPASVFFRELDGTTASPRLDEDPRGAVFATPA
jgi:MMP endo-(1,4)-3-O-methyl-alpha-D-mannosidase